MSSVAPKGARPSPRATPSVGLARDLTLVALARISASVAVWATGFRAVSDDDYARVTLAQAWAHHPVLDPTGTSWLPVPFWIYGGVMVTFGRALEVAQATAWALGLVSSGLVYWAARWITRDRAVAVAAGVIASVVPWCARLGVATVPELPTAAMTLLAMAALVPEPDSEEREPAARRPSRAPLLAGGMLLLATLSRYEPWFVAVGAVALMGARGVRATAARGRLRELGGAALAALGPLAWLVHNALAHGSALRFVERVADYKRAAGDDGGSLLERLLTYPVTMVLHEPELFFALAIVAFARWRWLRGTGDEWTLGRYRVPAALSLLLVVGLSLAAVRDGAPTHHPERAVLVVLLLVTVLAGDALLRFVRARPAARVRLVTLLATVLAIAASVRFRWVFGAPDQFADRSDEVAIGKVAAGLAAPGEKVLCEVEDYGFFAVMAGFARPEDFVKDREVDPRGQGASSFGSAEALRGRVSAVSASWLVARSPSAVEASGAVRVGRYEAWSASARR